MWEKPDTRGRSPWTERAKRRRFKLVVRVGINPCGCSRDRTVEVMAVLMLNVEAVCSPTRPPNVILADEGSCKVNAMLICDVG